MCTGPCFWPNTLSLIMSIMLTMNPMMTGQGRYFACAPLPSFVIRHPSFGLLGPVTPCEMRHSPDMPSTLRRAFYPVQVLSASWSQLAWIVADCVTSCVAAAGLRSVLPKADVRVSPGDRRALAILWNSARGRPGFWDPGSPVVPYLLSRSSLIIPWSAAMTSSRSTRDLVKRSCSLNALVGAR